MQENLDYYNILGVSNVATQEDIKKAYKKMALKWHPDRNNNSEESVEMFKKIGKAYEVLGNTTSREKYDNNDSETECDNDDTFDAFATFSNIFGDIFKMHGINSAINIEDFIEDDDEVVDCINYVEATIEDMYKGTTISKQYDRYSECEKCNGFGTKNGKLANCKKCKGSGSLPVMMGGMAVPSVCKNCNGTTIDKSIAKCVECKGAKFAQETVEVDLDISPGARDGTIMIIKGEGKSVPPEEVKKHGVTRSDAIFIIREKQHGMFKRGLIIPGKLKLDYADLMVELDISFEEALLGFTKNVNHPSGKPIKLCLTKPCRHGDTIVLEKHGMPKEHHPKDFGDLFIKIYVGRPNMTVDLKKNLSKILNYSHSAKTDTKHKTLDEYTNGLTNTEKCAESVTTNKKTTEKKTCKTTEKTPQKKTKNQKTSKTSEDSEKSNPQKNKKNTEEIIYASDSDDDYGVTVFHNANEKHGPHVLTKYPYNKSNETTNNYQNFMDDSDNDSDMNMNPMDVFKNFPQMMQMAINPADNGVFKSAGNGRYMSTMVHPDGHTTTTTTRTFVNGKEMSLEDIPGLGPDFLAGIPELENIPGLQGLFGIGKKKK